MPLCHPSIDTPTTVVSPFMSVTKITPTGCRVHALTLSIEQLYQRNRSPRCHCMVAGSYRLCEELRNHRSGNWECIVPLFVYFHSSELVPSRSGLLFCTCQELPAWLLKGDNVQMSFCVVQSFSLLHLHARAFQKLPRPSPTHARSP